MFSYRHAFHAGNHADVLKHMVLLASARHLAQKETGLLYIDTHGGAGLYRLDGDFARTSGEAEEGFLQLRRQLGEQALAPALDDYLSVINQFSQGHARQIYPGSPFLLHHLMRPQDRLRLFELHPTDIKSLKANMAQLDGASLVNVAHEDGFEALKKLLPPPSRRALVLCDPSYELKDDYQRVIEAMEDALKRFATGTYLVWYPLIPRAQAHDLPKRLKTLADRVKRPWLNATLTVKSSKVLRDDKGELQRPGLPASGMLVINPPYTLAGLLEPALAQVSQCLAQNRHAGFAVETSPG